MFINKGISSLLFCYYLVLEYSSLGVWYHGVCGGFLRVSYSMPQTCTGKCFLGYRLIQIIRSWGIRVAKIPPNRLKSLIHIIIKFTIPITIYYGRYLNSRELIKSLIRYIIYLIILLVYAKPSFVDDFFIIHTLVASISERRS